MKNVNYWIIFYVVASLSIQISLIEHKTSEEKTWLMEAKQNEQAEEVIRYDDVEIEPTINDIVIQLPSDSTDIDIPMEFTNSKGKHLATIDEYGRFTDKIVCDSDLQLNSSLVIGSWVISQSHCAGDLTARNIQSGKVIVLAKGEF